MVLGIRKIYGARDSLNIWCQGFVKYMVRGSSHVAKMPRMARLKSLALLLGKRMAHSEKCMAPFQGSNFFCLVRCHAFYFFAWHGAWHPFSPKADFFWYMNGTLLRKPQILPRIMPCNIQNANHYAWHLSSLLGTKQGI